MRRKDKLLFFIVTAVYGVGLYFFYMKYVPLIKGLQIALIPVIAVIFMLTVAKIEWGLLLFVFSFPLINNLPLFFRLDESIPHAPTALVIFLFFLLGFLVHNIFRKADLFLRPKILRPIVLLSAVIIVSSGVNFFRYSNFFPFIEGQIYELKTNIIGVTSGGALMATIFFGLNYLTGLAFFIIVISSTKSIHLLKKLIITLCLSTFVSLCFGLYQKFINMKFGNNPRSIASGMINATFKDALSFGAFVSIMISFILGIFFYSHWKGKIFTSGIFILALYLLFFSGSRSGLIATVVSLIIFFTWSTIRSICLVKAKIISGKKVLQFVSGFFIFILALGITVKGFRSELSQSKTYLRFGIFLKENPSIFHPYGRESSWKVASVMIRDYPFTGVGIGGYIIEAPNYCHEYKTKSIISESAENYFLQVASELGIIGLVLVLWIFWEIGKQAQRSYRAIQDNDRHKFILIGAIAGVIAFIINSQAHTYIGSYEIKYTFWLLVGLIFCMGKMAISENKENNLEKPDSAGEKVLWSKPFKVFGLVVIILYTAVHLWNSTHSLSLKSRTSRLGIKQDFGFYEHERTKEGMDFRWTRDYGGLSIKIEKPVVVVPILASHPDIYVNPVKVQVYLVKDFFKQKRLLKEITLTRSVWQTQELFISGEVGEEVILLFKVSRTWNPLKWRGTPDPRNLGIAVGNIEFREKPTL